MGFLHDSPINLITVGVLIGSDVHLTRSSNNSLTVIIVFSTVLYDPTLTVRTRPFPTLTSDD